MPKTIEEILYDLNTMSIKNKLMEFPSQILTLKARVREARKVHSEAKGDRDAEEVNILAEIAEEKNPDTGKPKFSNAEARQAELTRRKRTNKDYILAAGVARDAECQLNITEDELEAAWNRYKSIMFVAQIVAAEINLWSHELNPVITSVESVISSDQTDKEPY